MRWARKHKECPSQWLTTSVFKCWCQIIVPYLRLSVFLKAGWYNFFFVSVLKFVLNCMQTSAPLLCFWYLFIRLGWNLFGSDASWLLYRLLKKKKGNLHFLSGLASCWFVQGSLPFCWYSNVLGCWMGHSFGPSVFPYLYMIICLCWFLYCIRIDCLF